MSKLLSPDSMDSELDKFHHAFKEWGFFQLINHGMSSSLLEKLKAETEEFFNLPMEEKKKKLWKEPGEIEGFGEAFVVSEEQKLNWSDAFFVISLPTHLRKPNLIPKLPLPFRDTLKAYSAELKILAMKILNQMAKALRMEADDIKEFFEEGIQGIRLNYYPPCPQPELVMGLNPHSDNVGLTILLQLNEMEGLQFKKDGIWVPVKPVPNAFVINIGDMLEIVTNGIYRSNEHRATVNSVKERLSVGTFYSPKIDGNIGPAPSLITPQTPALFKTISMAEYLKGIFSSERRGGSYLDVMRRKNEEESG
ncbi:protein SRG1-like [Pistacia vera]|uniref:protein SRG1-like n=1 Tax=Pistacia vera TaxID=55513 RepID=UPI001262DEAA|nr:protein SRG1-like [Pistacia vera]